MSDTNISNLVDKATSEYLIGTDWGVNMQLCDYLTNDPQRSREAITKITKKMKEKKSRVQLLAIELLETLVKNCESVHPYVGAKECQAELIKLVQNKKTKDNVRDRALELVQYWAESFSRRSDLPLFSQTHMLLRKAGVSFPPRRKDEPPLVFKNAPVAVNRSRSLSSTDRQISPRGPVGSASLPKEFVSMRESISLANEMLSYINPEDEDPKSNDILMDIIATCKESMPSVRVAIETGNFTSDESMVEMLSLNDELLKVQELFDDLVSRREYFLQHGTSRTTSQQNLVQNNTTSRSQQSGGLLDLTSDMGDLRVGAQQPYTHGQGGLDEFDLLGGARPAHPVATNSAPAYNPFASPPVAHVQVAKPPVANSFDEFDMLASRHYGSQPTTTSSLPPSQPILTPLAPVSANPIRAPSSSSFPQTTTAPYTTPYATPFQSTGYQQPALPQHTSQSNINSAPILTPLKPAQPIMAATSPTAQSYMTTQPTTTLAPTQAYPAYNSGSTYPPNMGVQTGQLLYPMQQQPMMGMGQPMPYGGVPYGSYTQQMPGYYPQMQGGGYPNTNQPK